MSVWVKPTITHMRKWHAAEAGQKINVISDSWGAGVRTIVFECDSPPEYGLPARRTKRVAIWLEGNEYPMFSGIIDHENIEDD